MLEAFWHRRSRVVQVLPIVLSRQLWQSHRVIALA
ncbi:hypothetical protein V1279_001955 [Bradyrhizobium sp. AZCC 1610]